MNTPVLVATLITFLVAGLSVGRSASSRRDFFVAGRRGTTAVVGGSLFATIVGGSATIGVAGLVYQRGLTGAWWSLVGALGLVVLAVFFVRRIRASGVYTLPGLVEVLYGPSVAMLVAVLIVIAWMGVVSGQIVAAARIAGASGIGGTGAWIGGFTAVLIVYAVAGGQRAILRTDALQGALVMLGLAMAAVSILSEPDAIRALRTGLPDGAWGFPVNNAFGWSELLAMAIMVGSVYVVGPDIYTRVFSSRDEKTARRAVLLAAALIVPAAALVAIVGLAARALAPGIASEEALPWLMLNVLSGPAAIVFFVGLMGALMSSADSTLLGQGVVLAQDVIGRLRPLDDAHTVHTARVCVALLGLLSLVLALSLRGIIESLLFAYSVFTSGVVGPVLIGLLAGAEMRPSSRAAFVGILVGGGLGLAGALPFTGFPGKSALPLIGLGLSILLPVLLTRALRRIERGTGMIE